MKSATSPLRWALAGLFGPSGHPVQHGADSLLAVAGLRVCAYDAPTNLADPRLVAACAEAARRGMVITDAKDRLVGDLRAVSAAVVLVDCGLADVPLSYRFEPVGASPPRQRPVVMLTKSPKSADLEFPAPPCASGWMIVRTMVLAFDGFGKYARTGLCARRPGRRRSWRSAWFCTRESGHHRRARVQQRRSGVASGLELFLLDADRRPVWWPWPQLAGSRATCPTGPYRCYRSLSAPPQLAGRPATTSIMT